MRAPFISAPVQFRAAGSHIWLAAIVTNIRDGGAYRAGDGRLQPASTPTGWVAAVDLAVFMPKGGIRHWHMVGRLSAAADPDESSHDDVWRWAPELGEAQS